MSLCLIVLVAGGLDRRLGVQVPGPRGLLRLGQGKGALGRQRPHHHHVRRSVQVEQEVLDTDIRFVECAAHGRLRHGKRGGRRERPHHRDTGRRPQRDRGRGGAGRGLRPAATAVKASGLAAVSGRSAVADAAVAGLMADWTASVRSAVCAAMSARSSGLASPTLSVVQRPRADSRLIADSTASVQMTRLVRTASSVRSSVLAAATARTAEASAAVAGAIADSAPTAIEAVRAASAVKSSRIGRRQRPHGRRVGRRRQTGRRLGHGHEDRSSSAGVRQVERIGRRNLAHGPGHRSIGQVNRAGGVLTAHAADAGRTRQGERAGGSGARTTPATAASLDAAKTLAAVT